LHKAVCEREARVDLQHAGKDGIILKMPRKMAHILNLWHDNGRWFKFEEGRLQRCPGMENRGGGIDSLKRLWHKFFRGEILCPKMVDDKG
jgi:hypothetical protein